MTSYLQTVYAMIIFAMCLFGFFKGAGLLVTLTRGALKVIYLDLRGS